MKDEPNLTKLEYFTAAALTGFCAQYQRGVHSFDELAQWSVKTAWQTMKQLGLTNEDGREILE